MGCDNTVDRRWFVQTFWEEKSFHRIGVLAEWPERLSPQVIVAPQLGAMLIFGHSQKRASAG